MSENETKAQQGTGTVGKVLDFLGSRFETAAGELSKAQGKGLAQADALLESATRATHERLAFAEQIGSEWHKLLLAATRSATGLLTSKA